MRRWVLVLFAVFVFAACVSAVTVGALLDSRSPTGQLGDGDESGSGSGVETANTSRVMRCARARARELGVRYGMVFFASGHLV
jgi:hypothetical protein